MPISIIKDVENTYTHWIKKKKKKEKYGNSLISYPNFQEDVAETPSLKDISSPSEYSEKWVNVSGYQLAQWGTHDCSPVQKEHTKEKEAREVYRGGI